MKKFIIALTFLFTILEASAQTPARQQVDSILNLSYNSSYWKSTIDYMAKLDKEKAQKLQDAILYVANSPSYWPMRHYYLNGMAALKYKEIEGYALLVEEDWIIYNKIGKTYPNILPMEDIRVQPLKPVIYLYPEKQMDINVNLKFDSEELYTWPKVDANLGWSVTAQPDGMLTDAAGNEYPYLFWESKTTDYKWVDFSEGFVIKAEDTENFLRDKLKYLGLNSREFTDFITFWAPRLRQISIILSVLKPLVITMPCQLLYILLLKVCSAYLWCIKRWMRL